MTSFAINPFIVSSENSVKHWRVGFFLQQIYVVKNPKQKSQWTVTRKPGLDINPMLTVKNAPLETDAHMNLNVTLAVYWTFSENFLSFWGVSVICNVYCRKLQLLVSLA